MMTKQGHGIAVSVAQLLQITNPCAYATYQNAFQPSPSYQS
jgi:hypothetical protein